MRYALECPVESKMRLAQKVKVSWGRKTVFFDRDEGGLLNKIRIEGAVPDDDKVVARIGVLPNGLTDLSVTGGTGVHTEQLAELQSVESKFAFYYNLSRIRWEEHEHCDSGE